MYVRFAFAFGMLSLLACNVTDPSIGATFQVVSAGKTVICHRPPGNPSNVQVISIGKKAVAAHFRNHPDEAADLLCNDSVRCATTCMDNETCCNDDCADLETDHWNCGACGNVCGDGFTCEAGECTPIES